MNKEELKELMSIICEGQDSEQRRKVENFIEYQVQLIDSLDKEIERLKEMKLHTEKYASEMEDKYILEKSKNDKAIEYMERYMFSQKENYDYIHLSDILKGVDKE